MVKPVYYKIKECRICKNRKLKIIIDLNNQYIQGSFIKKNYPKPYLKKIPLQLVLCQKCSLVQLLYTTNKEILYKNYWYESGINKTMRMHLKDLVSNLCSIKKPKIKVNSEFKIQADLVIKSLGFDPENLPKLFNSNDLQVTKWGTLKVDFDTMESNLKGVFAAGDIVRGASLVVWAIRDGRDVAESIRTFLENKEFKSTKVA